MNWDGVRVIIEETKDKVTEEPLKLGIDVSRKSQYSVSP